MKKTTLKAIKNTAAIDITTADNDILYSLNPRLENIAYSHGTYGINGLLCRDIYNGQLYKIVSRSMALFIVL